MGYVSYLINNDGLFLKANTIFFTIQGNKTTSAPLERQSPFYSHAYTYEYNSNTGEPPSNEFPGAGLGPEDFHCERSLGSW